MSEPDGSPSNRIRIMTVDDHEIFRGGIAFALEAYEDLELVGGAHSGEEALRLCEQIRPDVILMDMRMPGLDGPATTQALRQRFPQVQILALTSFHDEQLVQRAMAAGAIGYLLKGIPVKELAAAIRAASVGRPTIDEQALQALIQAARSGPALGADLTDREQEVLALLVEGLSNPEIADRLVISLPTAKAHVRNILTKLRVSSRTEAATVAIKHNLVS
jgi:NarL family two-component system response regulator LiaR